MDSDRQSSGVRLIELCAAFSCGTDLGMGHPSEHVLRQTYLALRLGEILGLDEQEREVVYHASVLAWVGCHVDSYEQAKWLGRLSDPASTCGIDAGLEPVVRAEELIQPTHPPPHRPYRPAELPGDRLVLQPRTRRVNISRSSSPRGSAAGATKGAASRQHCSQ